MLVAYMHVLHRERVIHIDVEIELEYSFAGGGLIAGDEITLTIDLELTKPVEAIVNVGM